MNPDLIPGVKRHFNDKIDSTTERAVKIAKKWRICCDLEDLTMESKEKTDGMMLEVWQGDIGLPSIDAQSLAIMVGLISS